MQACPACGASNPRAAKFCNACGARLERASDDVGRASERRVVTMLFCDVRGSTAMAETLDAEEWTDVMNSAYEQLIAPVIRHEGTVARLMGDAILAFFGAPTAHEDDPQRAVKAGLEIVSAIAPLRERLARDRGLDLDVRLGINTGSVVVGQVGSELRQEYTAMGDAVNVAARMEQTAEPGTVQITEHTNRLVADLFDVEPLGRIELKGKREPVPAYRVRGRLAAPWRVRASRALEASLVGREAEMAVVRSALERIREGIGSIVLVVGEPGIGKSRLVEETNALWAELEPADERRWDFWNCVPYDAMQPYAQYRRMIRERAGIDEAEPPDIVRAKHAEMMRRIGLEGWGERSERVARALLGAQGDNEERLEGEAFQRAVVELVVRTTLAQGGRRLIVFEDLHWCDQASLELVRAMTRLVLDRPYVFLITFRPDPSAPSWPFKEWVESELGERAALIELRPLGEDQSELLIDELLPDVEMPERVRRAILEKTEGNPLFVHEVARSLIDAGAIERGDGGPRLADMDVAIPETVQSLITVGLDRLPGRSRRTLQTAAVIGRIFEEDVLPAVLDRGDVAEDLRELEWRDLIRAVADAPRPTYTFRHALTQEAAYGSLLVKDRCQVHLRVGRELEAAGAGRLEEVGAGRLEEVAPVLVHHFAEAGEDEATLRYAVLAGDAAARLYANAEAQAHYRTALDVALRIGAEPALLRSTFERRGTALELAGRHHEAVGNYEEMRSVARERGDEPMELAADGAIVLLYATPSPQFDAERGRRLAEETALVARRLGDRAAEARALWSVLVSSLYGGGGDVAPAIEAGEASLAIAESIGNRWGESSAALAVYRIELDRGEIGAAMASMRRCEEAGEQGGFLYAGVVTRADLARIAAYLGDGARALASAEQAVALAAERFPPGAPVAAIGRAEARLVLGDLEGARESLTQVEGSLLPEPERTFALAFAGLARARVALASGDEEEAVGAAEDVLRPLTANRVEILVAEALVILARAQLALGRSDEAERVLEDAAERADRLGERLPLWEALALRAEVLDLRGAEREGVELRRRARKIVDHVASGIDDMDLRRSFLTREQVRALAGT